MSARIFTKFGSFMNSLVDGSAISLASASGPANGFTAKKEKIITLLRILDKKGSILFEKCVEYWLLAEKLKSYINIIISLLYVQCCSGLLKLDKILSST